MLKGNNYQSPSLALYYMSWVSDDDDTTNPPDRPRYSVTYYAIQGMSYIW